MTLLAVETEIVSVLLNIRFLLAGLAFPGRVSRRYLRTGGRVNLVYVPVTKLDVERNLLNSVL